MNNKSKQRFAHGGARPGAGKPPGPPQSYIQMRVPASTKARLVRFAQRSKEGNLTRFLLAAADEKIERENKNREKKKDKK